MTVNEESLGVGLCWLEKQQFEDVTLSSEKFDEPFFFPSSLSFFFFFFFYRLNDRSINHEIIGRLIDDERNKIWLLQFSTRNNPIQILKHPVRTNYNHFCAPEPQVLVRMTHHSSAKKIKQIPRRWKQQCAQYTTTSQLWVQSFTALWILWKAVRRFATTRKNAEHATTIK